MVGSDDIAAGDVVCFKDDGPDPNKPGQYLATEWVRVVTSAGVGGTSFTATTFLEHSAEILVKETQGIFAARYGTQDQGVTYWGTSMAAPHVAGLAALIFQRYPGINAASVKDLIINTAELPAGTPVSLPGWNDRWGWGLINASAAINKLVTQTDLTFPGYPPLPGWLSPDISHTALNVGQPATVTVNIRNKGPYPAARARIHFGVHVFSAATPTFYDIGTRIVDIPVAPNSSTPVSIDWTPQDAGHQCLVVEIGYSPDTDHSNNKAQRNVAVAQSPVRFEVRNTFTEQPARISLVGTLANPDTGWTFRIEPASVILAADDGPATIEAELYPPANAEPGSQQTLHVAAIIDGPLGPVELGGISVEDVAPSK